MAKNKNIHVKISSPDSSEPVEFTVGDTFKPPMWMWRKAILKFAEKYPESPANDIMLLITSKPFRTEEEWAVGGYALEVREFIYRLYVWYSTNEHTPEDTVYLWIIRLWHYYSCGGPKPDLRNKPKKSQKQNREELGWRSQMVCSFCHETFQPALDMNRTKEELVPMFSTWIAVHVKSCKTLAWNKDQAEVVQHELEQKKLDAARFLLQAEEDYQVWLEKERNYLAHPVKTVAQLFIEEQQMNFHNQITHIQCQQSPVQAILLIQKAWKLNLKLWEDGVRVQTEDVNTLKSLAEQYNVVLKTPKKKSAK